MSSLKAYFADLVPNADASRTTFGLLPATDVKYTSILNKPGSFNVSMPLVLPDSQASSIGTNSLSVGNTLIVIERDDVPLFAGILTATDINVGGNKVTLAGLGFTTYFRSRYLRENWSRTDDQVVQVQNLIAYAQTGSGNIGVDTTRMVSTGVSVERNYIGYELNEIGKLIESFADNQQGFDTIAFVERSATGYKLGLTNNPNRLGRATDIVFDLDRGVESLSVATDGTDLANNVVVTGSGEGTLRVNGEASDPSKLDQYPLYETVQSASSDATSPETLAKKAGALLGRVNNPVVIPSMTVLADREPQLGTYRVGDRVRVRARYGFLDLDDVFKIMEMSVSDTNGAPVKVALKFEPVLNFEG